jgi:hypothetical protein
MIEGHRHDQYSQTDHSHLSDATKANLNSPTFTGTPAAPTAAVDTNTTQLATTAFVLAQAAGTAPAVDGTAATGTSTRYARQDHIHPTDTSRAALAGPTFTGVPAAPTASVDTNTTQLATTAFVLAQAAGTAPSNAATAAATGTSTRYARQDHVHSSALPSGTTYNGLAMKRIASGVASVTFTTGTGTLTYAVGLPFTPSSVVITPNLAAGSAFIVTLAGAPTATNVALRCWQATVASPSVVTNASTTISNIYWIAVE